MGHAVPTQHPAGVLRSHFKQLRALLAVALIAPIGLTVALVTLANDEEQPGEASSHAPIGNITASTPHQQAGSRPPCRVRRRRSRQAAPAMTVAPRKAQGASDASSSPTADVNGPRSRGPVPSATPAEAVPYNEGRRGHASASRPQAGSGTGARIALAPDDEEPAGSAFDSLPFLRVKQQRELMAGCPLTAPALRPGP